MDNDMKGALPVDWYLIDLFRVIRGAGRSDRAKAEAAADYVARHAQAARIEGAKAMQEAAAKEAERAAAGAMEWDDATDLLRAAADTIRSLDPQTIPGEAG